MSVIQINKNSDAKIFSRIPHTKLWRVCVQIEIKYLTIEIILINFNTLITKY